MEEGTGKIEENKERMNEGKRDGVIEFKNI
jgi:hypothetical protein